MTPWHSRMEAWGASLLPTSHRLQFTGAPIDRQLLPYSHHASFLAYVFAEALQSPSSHLNVGYASLSV
eukprot:m.207757 g.207757  ORF g.207757 m.207757 type:complete len:68 (-) comp25402_c0_seq2:466-669(-)